MRAGSNMCNRVALLAGILGLAAGLLLLAGEESRSADAIHQSPGDHAVSEPVAPPQPATQEPPTGDSYCQTCHADESLSGGFSNGRPLSLYVDARDVRDSAHELLTCVTCHDQLGTHPDEEPPLFDLTTYRIEANGMCERCHQSAADGYAASAHRAPEFEEGEGATCIDCHSPDGSGHSVALTSDPGSMLAPARIADTCGSCHERALNTYDQTSHGKVARFGDANTTATCLSCHGDHNVQAVEELALGAGLTGLSATCGECHDGAGESFARAWPGHSEGAPSGSTADLLERLGFLMATAVVASGLLHASLDLVRRRIDRDSGGA